MDHFGPFGNGEQILNELASAGEMSVTISGSGTGVLGYEDVDGNFKAYTDSEATLTGGAGVVVACGYGAKLMVSISGSSGDTYFDVGPVRS